MKKKIKQNMRVDCLVLTKSLLPYYVVMINLGIQVNN